MHGNDDFAGSACQLFPAAAPFHLTAKNAKATLQSGVAGVVTKRQIKSVDAIGSICCHVKPVLQKTEASAIFVVCLFFFPLIMIFPL